VSLSRWVSLLVNVGYKNYQNRSRLAKVIAKSLLLPFYAKLSYTKKLSATFLCLELREGTGEGSGKTLYHDLFTLLSL